MLSDKKKGDISTIFGAILTAGLVSSLQIEEIKNYFWGGLPEWYLNLLKTMAIFSLGIMSKQIFNIISEHKLRVNTKIHFIDEKIHISLRNMIYAEVIDVKIIFELIEIPEDSGRNNRKILKFTETVSVSSLPARKKSISGELYIDIPDKILKEINKIGLSRTRILSIRVLSTHPSTGYRSLTEPAIFESLPASEMQLEHEASQTPFGTTDGSPLSPMPIEQPRV